MLQGRQRCDIVNSDHIEDPECRLLMTEVYGELWAEIDLSGERYFETSEDITATGAASYDEPVAVLSTIRIVRVDSSDREIPLRELSIQEEPAYKGLTGGDASYYTLVDDQLFLYPNPSSGTYRWYYLQQPTDLSDYDDDDLVDVMCPAGLSFMLWGFAVLATAKAKGDVRLALDQKEKARELVQIWAANRHATKAHTRGSVVDDGDDIAMPTWERP